jgi:hypothetical protein
MQIEDSGIKPPKYLRNFYWEGDVDGISCLAKISEFLPPLPSVPDDELKNHAVTKTITASGGTQGADWISLNSAAFN